MMRAPRWAAASASACTSRGLRTWPSSSNRQQAAGDTTQQGLATSQVVRVDPFGSQATRGLPAILALQIGALGFRARHAQDAGGPIFDIQPDLVEEALRQRPVLGAPEQRELEEGVRKGCFDLRREHACRHSRSTGRQGASLEQRDPRP